MTEGELKAISELLAETATLFTDHSSNDYFVAGTPENLAVLQAAVRYNQEAGDEDDPNVDEMLPDGRYFIWDTWLMRYFAHRCGRGQPPLDAAELRLLGDLLATLEEDEFNTFADDDGQREEIGYLAKRARGHANADPARGFEMPPPGSIGINRRWQRSRKAALEGNGRWYANNQPETAEQLAYYLQHGEDMPFRGRVIPRDPGVPTWENLRFLSMYGLLNHWKWERAAVIEARRDGEAAASAFRAWYLEQMGKSHMQGLFPARNPGRVLQTRSLNLLATAMGFAIGERARAEAMARVQIAVVRQGLQFVDLGKVSASILRLLADHLGETPPAIEPDARLAALFAGWRDPDPSAVAPHLIAACDVHTHEAVPSGGYGIELNNGLWSSTPLVALLAMRLRQLRGLENPAIDHPLTSSAAGRLASEAPAKPEEAILQVEARMREDGFGESKVFAVYGLA